MVKLLLDNLLLKEEVAAIFPMNLPAYSKNQTENCSQKLNYLYCTRKRGHTGAHVAHTGIDGLAVAVWGEDVDFNDEKLCLILVKARLLA